jgi:hypothetical protein
LKTIIFRQRQGVVMPMNTAIVRRTTIRHIPMTNDTAKF